MIKMKFGFKERKVHQMLRLEDRIENFESMMGKFQRSSWELLNGLGYLTIVIRWHMGGVAVQGGSRWFKVIFFTLNRFKCSSSKGLRGAVQGGSR